MAFRNQIRPAGAPGGSKDPGSASGFFRVRTLDPKDRIEETARLHFQELQTEVFEPLRINVGARDVNALYGWAMTNLDRIAQAGPDKAQSVCMGLIYALLALEWAHHVQTGYVSYLTMLKNIDHNAVVVRTFLGIARRGHALHVVCQQRLCGILGDMASLQWSSAELVLQALQREVHPGDSRPGSASLLSDILQFSQHHIGWLGKCNSTARHSFVWAMRWASALDSPPSLELEDAAERLRKEALQLAEHLWADLATRAAILDAGPSLLWALLHCHDEAYFSEIWKLAAVGDCCEDLLAQEAPQSCLGHLLSEDQHEELAYIVGSSKGIERYCQWFACKHLGAGLSNRSGSNAHLADIILCALQMAEKKVQAHTGLWAWFWGLCGNPQTYGNTQGHLAFLFAARKPGYAREAFMSVLSGASQETRSSLVALARSSMPPDVVPEVVSILGGSTAKDRRMPRP